MRSCIFWKSCTDAFSSIEISVASCERLSYKFILFRQFLHSELIVKGLWVILIVLGFGLSHHKLRWNPEAEFASFTENSGCKRRRAWRPGIHLITLDGAKAHVQLCWLSYWMIDGLSLGLSDSSLLVHKLAGVAGTVYMSVKSKHVLRPRLVQRASAAGVTPGFDCSCPAIGWRCFTSFSAAVSNSNISFFISGGD